MAGLVPAIQVFAMVMRESRMGEARRQSRPSKSVILAIRMFCAATLRCDVAQIALVHYLEQQQNPPE